VYIAVRRATSSTFYTRPVLCDCRLNDSLIGATENAGVSDSGKWVAKVSSFEY